MDLEREMPQSQSFSTNPKSILKKLTVAATMTVLWSGALGLVACSEDRLVILAECGNGVLEAEEQCDEGALNANEEPYRCRQNCSLPQPLIAVDGPTAEVVNLYEVDPDHPTPPGIHALIACGENRAPLIIRNVGYADLIVTQVAVDGTALVGELMPYPLVLAPGESRSVGMTWSPGRSVVRIDSNVAGQEQVFVHVNTEADPPPTIEIVTPTDGLIFDEDADHTVRATVGDPNGAPESLAVVWHDGTGESLAEGEANARGVSEFVWGAASRHPGPQMLHATVIDTCGNVVTTSINVCQQLFVKTLGVWLVDDDFTELFEEQFLGEIMSYTGELTSVENYNYYSASAHPEIGPEPVGYETNVYFYDGPDGLTLNFFSNLDAGGSDDSTVDWNIRTTGNAGADTVMLSDDRGELSLDSHTDTENRYQARFRYWANTDGGIIGPFEGDEYQIWVNVMESGDNTSAVFYSADGTSFPLTIDESISSFAVAFRRDAWCDEPDE